MEDEVNYKQATAKNAAELLSEDELTSLLRGNAYEVIIRRIEEVGKDNNLLFRGAPMSGDNSSPVSS